MNLSSLLAVNVYLPKDRVTNAHQGYGFVEFRSEEDADYSIKILNMVKIYGKPIRVNKASQDKNSQDVGANLFIGNLDPDVDEKVGLEHKANFLPQFDETLCFMLSSKCTHSNLMHMLALLRIPNHMCIPCCATEPCARA